MLLSPHLFANTVKHAKIANLRHIDNLAHSIFKKTTTNKPVLPHPTLLNSCHGSHHPPPHHHTQHLNNNSQEYLILSFPTEYHNYSISLHQPFTSSASSPSARHCKFSKNTQARITSNYLIGLVPNSSPAAIAYPLTESSYYYRNSHVAVSLTPTNTTTANSSLLNVNPGRTAPTPPATYTPPKPKLKLGYARTRTPLPTIAFIYVIALWIATQPMLCNVLGLLHGVILSDTHLFSFYKLPHPRNMHSYRPCPLLAPAYNTYNIIVPEPKAPEEAART